MIFSCLRPRSQALERGARGSGAPNHNSPPFLFPANAVRNEQHHWTRQIPTTKQNVWFDPLTQFLENFLMVNVNSQIVRSVSFVQMCCNGFVNWKELRTRFVLSFIEHSLLTFCLGLIYPHFNSLTLMLPTSLCSLLSISLFIVYPCPSTHCLTQEP